MAINLADNIRVGQQKPIDDKYFNGLSPYTNVAQAKSLILSAVRHRGLTVNVAGVEWWWKDGIADNQLVVKTVDLSGYVPFTGSTTNVVLGGQLTTPQINFASSYINGNGEVINLSATGGVNPTHAFFDKGLRFYNGAAYVDIKSDNITGNQSIQVPNASGTLALTTDCQAPLSGTGIVKSASGSISYINGVASQYVRGDGTLASFPTSAGGGSSVNYYLNGSISQGTFGGATYYQMSKTPVLGAGTDFIRTNAQGNGYIASFITDVGDPSLLNIPGGNWNVEFYFESSSTGGSPKFYGEVYKVDVANNFTLVGTGSVNPESITNSTTVDQYFTSIPVAQTTLLVTDRIAIRIYVITSGKTITLHTENGNLCEVITTFSAGLTALNGLTRQVQYFDGGTTGTDFNIVSTTDTHVFNLPTASAANRGALSSTDWTTFNNKQNASSAIKTIIRSATASATLTGTLTETLIGTYLIPANTFGANDILRIPTFTAEKTGIIGTVTMRVKIGPTNVFGSSNTLATYTTSAVEAWCIMQRSSFTLRGGNIRGLQATIPRQTDIVATSGIISVQTFNPAVDNYIFTSLQLSNIADSVFQSNFLITN